MSRTGFSGMVSSTVPLTAVPLTISAWFYPTSFAANGTIASANGAGGDRHELRCSTAAKVEAVSRMAGPTTGSATISTTAVINTWSHACGVFASATSRSAYLNGAGKVTNATNITPVAMSAFTIGATPSVFVGLIADVALWNVALTDAEILALSKGVSPMRVRRESLVSYIPLYGAESPEPDLVAARTYSIGTTTKGTHSAPVAPSMRRMWNFSTPEINIDPFVPPAVTSGFGAVLMRRRRR